MGTTRSPHYNGAMDQKPAFLCLIAWLGACATPMPEGGETAIREVALNEPARLMRLQVTPSAVIEDSRCPMGVQCIQAGTVRIEARIAGRTSARTTILGLGVPSRTEGGWLTLVQACPYPVHGAPFPPGAYRFRLMLSAADTPPVIEAPACPRP